jgi:AcrR family transcriptional regulator
MDRRRLQAEMRSAPEQMAPEAERVVTCALDLAEERGFDNVRLFDVATRAAMDLATVRRHFADLDAVANAWFEDALRAAIAIPPEEVQDQPPPERLLRVMLRWFGHLAPRRRLAGEIVQTKAWPAHAHHWVPMVFDLSRLMHWFLDAARIASTGRRRALAEVGLTLAFLAAFAIFVRERDPALPRTRRFLARRLAAADRVLALVP